MSVVKQIVHYVKYQGAYRTLKVIFHDFLGPFCAVSRTFQDHLCLLRLWPPIKITRLGHVAIGNLYQKFNLIVFDDNVVNPCRTESHSRQ